MSRKSSRMAGAAGALLLQAGFLAVFLAAMPKYSPPRDLARELTLILPRLNAAKPAPVLRAEPAKAPEEAPPAVTPAIASPPTITVPGIVNPGIAGFGQALNGCAPQLYRDLTPEQRAHCPRPGEGVAIQEQPSLTAPRSQAKDEAFWQEKFQEDHWMPGLCDPREGNVALCMMHQAMAESKRAQDVQWHLARDKTAALKAPPAVLPPKPAAAK